MNVASQPRSPPGTGRLFLPALLGWPVTAWAITNPGVAQCAMWISVMLGLVCCAAVAIPRIRWRLAPNAVRVLGALLVVAAVLVVMNARIMQEEFRRADPGLARAAQLGLEREMRAVLTAFPEVDEHDFGRRDRVDAIIRTPRGGVPVVLWLNGPAPDDWAPTRNVVVRGSLHRLASGGAAYGVRVRELEALLPHDVRQQLGVVAAALRHGLRDAAAVVPGAELVPGFAVGDTTLVSEALDQAMRESSLSHLLAVSGANCALITGAVLRLAGLLGCGRKSRAVIAAAALIGFVVLVGPDPSVQRAAVMSAVLLASDFGGRRAVALPALGLAMLVLLINDPWQALHPGFSLSVAATGGILLLATPLANGCQRRLRIPRVLALPIAVAVAAQVSCGPLLLLLQPGLPVAGVLANVVAAPAAPLGTALGMVALTLLPWSTVLGYAAVHAAMLPAQWVAATAQLAQQLPFARWPWPGGWLGAVLLALCEAVVIAAWALTVGEMSLPGIPRAPRRSPWHPRPPATTALRVAVAMLCSGALGMVAALSWVTPLAQRIGIPRDWAVVACDVGQGDALLLRNPRNPGDVIMVDTGDDPVSVQRCLRMFRVDRIRLLVLSHDDRDHVGALEAIVHRVDAALIAPTLSGEEFERRSVVRTLRAAHVPFRSVAAGDRGGGFGMQWRVLGPPRETLLTDTNAASLVMHLAIAGTTVLLLGDTGREQQQALLHREGSLRADVLKIAHHGSGDQDHALPAATGASWALISVGADNRYGHPHPRTLAAIEHAGARVLRTDVHGSVALRPLAGGGLEAWVEHAVPRRSVGAAP